MIKFLTVSLLAAFAFFMDCAFAQNEDSHGIVGSWRLQKIVYHLPDKEVEVNPVQGGRWIFTSNRYALMYVPTTAPRAPFQVLAKPTDSEVLSGFQSVVFNSGSFELEGEKLVTTADIAKVPGFEGGRQFYQVNITGHQLVLRMVDEIYPDQTKPDWSGKVEISFYLQKE